MDTPQKRFLQRRIYGRGSGETLFTAFAEEEPLICVGPNRAAKQAMAGKMLEHLTNFRFAAMRCARITDAARFADLHVWCCVSVRLRKQLDALLRDTVDSRCITDDQVLCMPLHFVCCVMCAACAVYCGAEQSRRCDNAAPVRSLLPQTRSAFREWLKYNTSVVPIARLRAAAAVLLEARRQVARAKPTLRQAAVMGLQHIEKQADLITAPAAQDDRVKEDALELERDRLIQSAGLAGDEFAPNA